MDHPYVSIHQRKLYDLEPWHDRSGISCAGCGEKATEGKMETVTRTLFCARCAREIEEWRRRSAAHGHGNRWGTS